MADVNHTVLIPEELNDWARKEVVKRRETGKYSMGGLLRDGLRALQARGMPNLLRCDLCGTPEIFNGKSEVGFAENGADCSVGTPVVMIAKPTAAELAAKLGIKTGATIEEVEPRIDQDSGYISPEQVT